MKKNILFFTLMAGIILFSSCEKRWFEPEFAAPTYNKKANKKISDIKALHTVGAAPDSILSTRDFIIEAWVVSSDEGGNFYKSMFVQDATGGIEIPIDQTGLYNDFPVGQKVFIDCKKLLVGDYRGIYQMGWLYEGAVGRINSHFINKHIFKSGFPDPENMPKPTLISGAADLTPENVGTLVEIRECEFTNASIGKPLASNDYITEHTVNFNSTSVTLRTSNYAKFRSKLCPEGKGTLIGILTVYNSNYQLMVRTSSDIIFGVPEEPEETILKLTFDGNSFTTGGWARSNPTSATAWYVDGVAGDQFMFHVPTTAPCDDWLISPEITIDNRSGVSLVLEHFLPFQGQQEFFQVYYAVNPESNFNENDWTAFDPPNINNFPETFGPSNKLDVSVIPNKTFRIAIRYHNTSNSTAARWGIKNIQFKK